MAAWYCSSPTPLIRKARGLGITQLFCILPSSPSSVDIPSPSLSVPSSSSLCDFVRYHAAYRSPTNIVGSSIIYTSNPPVGNVKILGDGEQFSIVYPFDLPSFFWPLAPLPLAPLLTDCFSFDCSVDTRLRLPISIPLEVQAVNHW